MGGVQALKVRHQKSDCKWLTALCSSLRQLRVLTLLDCPGISDAALEHIMHLPALQSLYLDSPNITEEGAQSGASMHCICSVNSTRVLSAGYL